jgi:hypothetical protein
MALGVPAARRATEWRSPPPTRRLVHHAEVIALKGDNYRLKGRRKEAFTKGSTHGINLQAGQGLR